MKTRTLVLIGAALLCALAVAEAAPAPMESGQLTLPDFRSLESQASESVVVTMGPWLLRFASHFADDKDPDSAAARRVLANIKSITVHSYQFDRDFVYSRSDVDAVRAQLGAPNWNRLVQVRGKDRKNVDVYVSMEHEKTTGLAVISCEPRELTIVNIVGSISPEDLRKISGHLDLPGVSLTGTDATGNDPAPNPPAT